MEVSVGWSGWYNLELHKTGWKHREAIARRERKERERKRGDITKFIAVKKRVDTPAEDAPTPAASNDWQALLAAFDAAIHRSDGGNTGLGRENQDDPGLTATSAVAARAPSLNLSVSQRTRLRHSFVGIE
ncbi:hypothetical protein AURDEDRAFT_124659 [Auricularia subglabra TFB-10046 SS5]|nr:hypothetical protein AURDEDRAFT_124659 [Auricularia subglabra TFB-10046 SS5]